MRSFFSMLLWTVVFLLILLVIDQLLVRVPASAPAHVAVATFYRDLRERLVDLAKGVKMTAVPTAPEQPVPPAKADTRTEPASVEAIIEQKQAQPTPAAKAEPRHPLAKDPAPRYVYADSQGELHFADTLAEVPEPYRTKAKVLGK